MSFSDELGRIGAEFDSRPDVAAELKAGQARLAPAADEIRTLCTQAATFLIDRNIPCQPIVRQWKQQTFRAGAELVGYGWADPRSLLTLMQNGTLLETSRRYVRRVGSSKVTKYLRSQGFHDDDYARVFDRDNPSPGYSLSPGDMTVVLTAHLSSANPDPRTRPLRLDSRHVWKPYTTFGVFPDGSPVIVRYGEDLDGHVHVTAHSVESELAGLVRRIMDAAPRR